MTARKLEEFRVGNIEVSLAYDDEEPGQVWARLSQTGGKPEHVLNLRPLELMLAAQAASRAHEKLHKKMRFLGNAAPPTHAASLSPQEIEKRLSTVETKIGYGELKGSARKWWDDFKKANEKRLALVLNLAEELRYRNATLLQFFLSYVYSETDNIQANLHFLDAERLRKDGDGPLGGSATERWLELGEAETFDDSTIAYLQPLLRDKLKWNSSTLESKRWWELIEDTFEGRLAGLLNIGEEFYRRNADIDEIFLNSVLADSDNLAAILCFTDFSRMKYKERQLEKLTQSKPGLADRIEQARRSLVDARIAAKQGQVERWHREIQREDARIDWARDYKPRVVTKEQTSRVDFYRKMEGVKILGENAAVPTEIQALTEVWSGAAATYPGIITVHVGFSLIDLMSNELLDAVRRHGPIRLFELSRQIMRSLQHKVHEKDLGWRLLGHLPDPGDIREDERLIYASFVQSFFEDVKKTP